MGLLRPRGGSCLKKDEPNTRLRRYYKTVLHQLISPDTQCPIKSVIHHQNYHWYLT